MDNTVQDAHKVATPSSSGDPRVGNFTEEGLFLDL
jgi:hypothetical protein